MYEKGKRKAMKKKKTQLLGIVLSAAMLATSVPVPAYAEPTDNVAEEEENSDAAAVQETTDEADAVADDAATVDDATDDSTAADDATPEEADEQDTADEADAQAAEEGENEITVAGDYTISLPTINFPGANAAIAKALVEDVEIDEEDPAIQSLRAALEDLEVVGGEAGLEDETNAIATYDAEGTEGTEDTEKKNALSQDQIDTVVGLYDKYQKQWVDNAEYLGVQNPFFLDFNDDEDGLGVMGEMLALDGASVEDVRNGKYTYDDLVGMILNFTYGDKLGIYHYGEDVLNARDEVLDAVEKSGAQTKAQKLLVINDWLAHENTFDMPYIMNSGKKDVDKPMIAGNEQPQEHETEVNETLTNDLYDMYEQQITASFHDQIFAGIEASLRQNYYEQAIQNVMYQQYLGKDEADATEDEKTAAQDKAKTFVEENKEAIDSDPDGFVRETFKNEELADQLKAGADDFIKKAEDEGIEYQGQTVTVEQMTQNSMATDKIVDLDEDGTNDTTANDAIPIYAKGAISKLTTGVINYWEGTQFGALGMGKSVCLGYSKAYAYLVQCMDKNVYLEDPDAGYTSTNWKKSKELYYDANGNINIDAGYTVDLVRISFKSNVTMFGHTEANFASDHYWNAVRIGETWYYVDPCYTDVYTEVMSRDRVETDGDMNHGFFLFSETSTESLYDGNYTDIRSLYKTVATDKSYEKSWMARAASNVYYADGYAYYLYDSTDLFSRANTNSMTNSSDTEYKLVRHKLTTEDADNTGDEENAKGDSDYETLINFTDTKSENTDGTDENADDTTDETFVSVLKDGKMEKNDLLTKLYAQFVDEQKIYPSIGLTAALYSDEKNKDQKIYFNVSNDVMSYDVASGEVATVKEYNTVSAVRDDTNLFGGMAFSTVADAKNADFTVVNHPIAGLTIKEDGTLYVSIATNYGFISGKKSMTDHDSLGYEYEETDYNSYYTNYSKYRDIMGDEKNDNDEFMWSANFVDEVKMDDLTGETHTHQFASVSVPATCGRNAFTEERCTTCDVINPDVERVEKKNTAHEHHYIEFKETYYTLEDSNNEDSKNTGVNYVCPECGASATEPAEPKYNMSTMKETYEKRMALYNAAKENAAEGHSYSVEDPEWSEDYSTVSFQNLKCDSCAEKVDKIDCLLSTAKGNETTQDAVLNSIKKTLDDKMTVEAKIIDQSGTCDEGVTTLYKAEGTTKAGYKYSVSKEHKGEAGQHTYENVEFNWDAAAIKDEDGNITGYKTEQEKDSAVTVGELKCTACGKVEENATVSVVKDTEASKAPTCEEAGEDVYVATVKDANDVTIAEDTKKVTLQALGHKWKSDATFDWKPGDNNTYTATATFTCERNAEHTETVDATVVEAPEGATCTTAGKITYTATAEYEGVKAEDSKTKDVPALGHNWSTPKLTWSETEGDAPTVTGVVTCERCKEEETVEVTVAKTKTEDPTCETKGANVYTATTKDPNGKEYTEEHSYEIPALGHEWNAAPVWNWSDDNETATATFTCERNNEHTQDVKAEVTKEDTVKATCEEEGTVTYTATVTGPDGQTYTDQRTKNVPATGHDWNEATWSWTENASGGFDATVTITCKNNMKHGKTETVTATKTEVKEATCGEAGSETYKAETTDMDGNVISDTHVKPLPKTGNHTYGDWVVTKKATAVETGVKEKTCTVCGKVKTGTVKKLTPKGKLNMETIYLQVDQSTTAWEVVGMQRGDSVASYKVKSKKVATVTKDGKIVAKKKGTTKFVVTLASGKVIETTLKVQSGKVRTTKLAVSKTSVTLKVGKRSTIETTLTPLTSQESLSYKTSNKKVAAVTREGKIVAKGKGKATVTVTSGSQSVKINVTVK